jgi:hypothetical protein
MGDYGFSGGDGDVYGQYGGGGGSGGSNGGALGLSDSTGGASRAWGNNGLFGTLNDLIAPNARKYKRAMNSYARGQAKYRIDQLARERANFDDQSQRKTEELQQDMVSRGLGGSSIEHEDEAYYERVKQRTYEQLGQEQGLAQQNADLVEKRIKYERGSTYAHIVDSIVALL